MSAEDAVEPPMYYVYFYCGGTGLDISAGRSGSDISPDHIMPIPDGCTEITKEQYEVYLAEIQAAKDARDAAEWGRAQQAADDRLTELVAAKVAEALAAQGDA